MANLVEFKKKKKELLLDKIEQCVLFAADEGFMESGEDMFEFLAGLRDETQ